MYVRISILCIFSQDKESQCRGGCEKVAGLYVFFANQTQFLADAEPMNSILRE
jgi:hypothetical protein